MADWSRLASLLPCWCSSWDVVLQDFTATWQAGQYARYFFNLLQIARRGAWRSRAAAADGYVAA